MEELIPQYVPTQHKMKISDCVDDTKTRQLIKDIEKSDISPVEKKLLTMAAQRHLVFNYKNIVSLKQNTLIRIITIYTIIIFIYT